MAEKFKVGDRVRYISAQGRGSLTKGRIYTLLASEGHFCDFKFINDIDNDHYATIGWLEENFELVEETNHPFKAGVKYFTRDKKSWRRFVGENLDRNGPYTSGVFTDLNGGTWCYTIDHPQTSITTEEYTEPPKEIDITRPQDYCWDPQDDWSDHLKIIGLFKNANEMLLVVSEDKEGFFDTDYVEPTISELILKSDKE
jgi:hypothetical protein